MSSWRVVGGGGTNKQKRKVPERTVSGDQRTKVNGNECKTSRSATCHSLIGIRNRNRIQNDCILYFRNRIGKAAFCIREHKEKRNTHSLVFGTGIEHEMPAFTIQNTRRIGKVKIVYSVFFCPLALLAIYNSISTPHPSVRSVAALYVRHVGIIVCLIVVKLARFVCSMEYACVRACVRACLR